MKYLKPNNTFFWILISILFMPIGGIMIDFGMVVFGITTLSIGVALFLLAPLASEIIRNDK